jgi:hypothetical protein
MKTLEEVKKYFNNAKVIKTITGFVRELNFDSIHEDNMGCDTFTMIWGRDYEGDVFQIYRVDDEGEESIAEIIEYHEPLVKYTNDNLKPFEGNILENLNSRLEPFKIALDEVYEQLELLTRKENY